MRKIFRMCAAALGLVLVGVESARAEDGDGLSANVDQLSWSRWQGRISSGVKTPTWRSGLGGFESGGFNVIRPGGVNSISLMADYYFAPSFVPTGGAGGFRATSGVIVGPRSQPAVTPPGAAAGGLFNAGSRLFDSSSMGASVDPASDIAALPYLGLGYTGLAARGSLGFSADLGMIGQAGSDAAARPFGTGARSLSDSGRDTRLMPMVKLGMFYSF